MNVAEAVTALINVRRSLPSPERRAQLRRDAGITQDALAEILGVTRSTLTYWESGKRNPSGASLTRYLEALNAMAAATEQEDAAAA
jgi:transcriptional regulator with XRE-family HTH domain